MAAATAMVPSPCVIHLSTDSEYVMNGLRALAFLDAGGLLAPGARASLPSLMAETRLSCGLGLALAPAAFARLELNYGWVLRARPGDVAKGLQFGVAAAFGS